MIPRKRLDLDWSDLLCGLRACLMPGDAEAARTRLEKSFSRDENVACLSVRTGFDALLAVLDLPAGSEVLVSAITIRDMPGLLEEHGLVAVPVDVDSATLAVDPDSLRQAVTPRTKAILVAHLFGSRMPLDPIVEFAREHGLIVFEDCAQAFTGDGYRGHSEADVSMFSFGPIKTATALGGAILRVRDAALAEGVREHLASWPRQTNRQFFARLLKYALLMFLSQRWAYTIFIGLCRLLGCDHDQLISRNVRGFAGGDLLAKLRRQPSPALLSLLEQRLANYTAQRTDQRRRLALRATELLGVDIPGQDAAHHTWWVFPILHDDPQGVIRRLYAHGFDATCGASGLHVVPPPSGERGTSVPRCVPVLSEAPTEQGGVLAPAVALGLQVQDSPARAEAAEKLFARLLYLPVYPGLSERDLKRMAAALRGF